MSETDLTERSIARVQEIYGRYAAGDREALYGALTPDATWTSIGDASIPWSGVHRGRAGVENYFAIIDAEAKVIGYEVERVIAQGEWVAVLATATIRYAHSGRDHRYAKADFIRLDGSNIAEFREFYDTTQTSKDRGT
ncbi:MAG: hypothetical protein JWR10_605 [Rubritepida sp.]|nr:hypothetical protein [Rubritepida sp.]